MTTYWNGEPTFAVRGTATVNPDPRPLYWGRDLMDRRIPVVLVEYGSQRFYLDNRDGSGWRKVTEGRGSPRRGHRQLSGVTDFQVDQS